MTESVAIIIPVKNESATIGAVLSDISAHAPDASIIVVDDNSTDATLQKAQKHPGVVVLHSGVCLGIGGAVQLGVRFALDIGCEVFVRMDGDGQHDARFIPDLVSKTAPRTLVVGSRTNVAFARSSGSVRNAGSGFFRLLFVFFARNAVSDPTSGFVCFGRDIACLFARYLPMEYPEIESTVLLLRAGYSVKSASVVMRPRQAGHSSITVFRSFVYMISVTVAFIVSFFRKNPYHT
jgi:glycosyltransferase involved in cell wall biosynthesis